MCIIIHNPAGKSLDKELLSIAYDNNPHGVGAMWQERGDVHTIKSLCNFDDIWELTKHLEGFCYTLHFRWRTVGPIHKKQCHPHKVLNKNKHGMNMYMMHNGTITNIKNVKGFSDTQIFAQKLRSSYEQKFQNIRTLLAYMHGMIPTVGTFNKFVLMSENSTEIINESAGIWRDNIWYSNIYSFEPGYRKKMKIKKSFNSKSKRYIIGRDKDNKAYKTPIELYTQPKKEITA